MIYDGVQPVKWVSVKRSGLRRNAEAIRRHLEAGSAAGRAPSLIAVVKADAYGHGLVQAAEVFEEAGVDMFAVTTADEALDLRAAGIESDILVFLPPAEDHLQALLYADITMTVADGADAARIGAAATRLQRSARVHLKVDSGMGRLGVLPGDAAAVAAEIGQTAGIALKGVYTHFARALDPNAAPTNAQFATFRSTLAALTQAGIDPGMRHCANSAGILLDSRYWLDAVRPGTILYGQYPAGHLPKPLTLSDSWRLNVRIAALRSVPSGTAVGYGGEFVTRRPTRLAVLPLGYADGFTVAPSSTMSGMRGVKSILAGLRPGHTGPAVTIRDRKAPVAGRVAMQLTSVDVTDIPDVAVGDIVTVPARRIMTSSRIPRIYED